MDDIDEWIRRQLDSGYAPEQVKESLEESGWDPELVDEVLGGGKETGKRAYLYAGGAVAVVLVAALLYFYPFGDVRVTRSIESPARPGSTPEVVLSVEGSYRSLTVEEKVPEGLGVEAEGAEVDEEENIVRWELDGESNVSYKAVTPGASTGEYRFNGTYLYGFSTNEIQGDELLEVRW